MGATLLAQTILICLILGLINLNYWFSYILFIIIIGGLLILFIYITSIASNEKFKFSIIIIFLTLIAFSLILLLTLFSDYFLLNINFWVKSISFYIHPLILPFSLNKYLNYPTFIIFIISILYLLICLIASVNISLTFKGPLRQNN